MNTTHNTSQLPSLALDITSENMSYLIYGNAEKIETGTIKLINNAGDFCKALENAVYDNAFLLNDYASANIAVHSQHFALMPQEMVKCGMAQKVLEASFTTVDGDMLSCLIAGTDAAIACDSPHGVVGFLRRTFTGAKLLHHLAPLCSYSVGAYAEETACMHISLNKIEAHIVVVANGKLHMANTFQYRALEDVAYYALNMWKTCQLDNRRDKVLLTGENEPRTLLAEQLRQWIAYVMPEVVPAQALRLLGGNATTLPFNLITLALSN